MPGNRHRAMTLNECGKQLGISSERVRQIEKSALLKLFAHLWLADISLDDCIASDRGIEMDSRISDR